MRTVVFAIVLLFVLTTPLAAQWEVSHSRYPAHERW